MANTLLTIGMITAEAVALFRNSNAFLQSIDTQYDDAYGVVGAKIGSALKIRLPVDYIVANGPGMSAQDTSEQSTTLNVSTQRHVDIGFNTAERTLSVDNFAERHLAPAMNNLAGNVAATVMAGSGPGVCNVVANVDGSNNILTPTLNEFLNAKASLETNSAPLGSHKVVLDPYTMARVAGSLTGLLNPSQELSKQYRDGSVKNAVGFDWMNDQTVVKMTAGNFTSGTVNGASQTGTTLLVNAITGTLNAGDIITIAGVNQVNRVNKMSTGSARQFVVTANVASGATSIPIYPAIVPGSVSYNPTTGDGAQAYQTVDVSPANSAAISLFTNPSAVYRRNIAFSPKAVTMASADMTIPPSVEAARKVYDGVSMRAVTQYAIATDQCFTRIDYLFGFLYVKPEWAVAILDII